ncbi:DUF4352 domain-containing protein [Nonomuraea sp. K274]|uniref:DUF4352 domain-containing protein n=1 Tax=Nonomuraea cypriaca TaxID=1187855 RepID=A0A931A8D0_9ACTN|nr:DUF4352 domain-containing protein [Nonomuraea cypriaca]
MEDDAPQARLDPTTPPSSAPGQEPSSAPEQQQEQPPQQPASAKVGDTLTLEGIEPGLKVDVTVNQVVSTATSANTFIKPDSGKRFVAVQVTLTNKGTDVYSDSPTNGAWMIDNEGQQYRASIVADVREGESFGGSATINTGDSRKGMIVFELPESATPAKLQFALNSGFAEQKGEWRLN